MGLFQPKPGSVLFVVLDSCRYDTFASAAAPSLKRVGPLHRAMAPSHFTYGSHASMFVGFTPGDASLAEPFVNPKYGKIFKMRHATFGANERCHFELEGRTIIDGFRRAGYRTVGTGAVAWFDPRTEAGRTLTQDFDSFYYPETSPEALPAQLDWIAKELSVIDRPVFLFLNIGETHVPYHHPGAGWSADENPCIPFSPKNDRAKCRARQTACLEYADRLLGPLTQDFMSETIVVTADHGDCWGEDGLWEHAIHHEKTLEVPLVYRLGKKAALKV